MKLLIIAVGAACVMSLHAAVTAPREPSLVQLPTPATLAAHYDRTGRMLAEMGEGFE